MVSPFGVSAGDFIAVIGNVKDVIKALRASGGASHEFIELVHELHNLQIALLEIKALDSEIEQERHRIALRQAATTCQGNIDDFLHRLRKYQPYLGKQNVSHGWRDVVRNIQWQLCKKDDLVKFRAEIGSNVHCIHMLMLSIQV